jgi:drug/metabolite transporter (DMT)-like permease
VGIVNSVLPFIAYGYAALAVTTGLSAVFNATSPLWAAAIAWVWLGSA